MLRAGIVGCGKIADQHVQAIRRAGGARIVAVCDRELRMAGQLAERFGVPGCFGDLGEMLRSGVDVVHITTPPQGHFVLARQCLESGCHVYLEKPFTVTAGEAQELIEAADRAGLKLVAGHNLQFTPEMLTMRRLVRDGWLGGKPVHVESHFSYSLEDASYVGPVLGDRGHWVRQLPGQLFHNIISHGIAKLAEFLDDIEQLSAIAHQSDGLRAMGGGEVLDELRVLLRDRSGTTAVFCFTTQIRPGMNQLRVYGPANSLVVDHASGSCLRLESRSCKSYLTYVVPQLGQAREYLRNAWINFRDIVRGRLHQDAGMKEIFERFYRCIRLDLPNPIPCREILLTARIMDEIFRQVYGERGVADGDREFAREGLR